MLRLMLAALTGRKGQTFALGLLVAATIAIATAAPIFAGVTDARAIDSELSSATPGERSLITNAGVGGANANGLDWLRRQARAVLPQPELTEVYGGWVQVTAGKLKAPLTARSGMCERLVLNGSCPTAANEVVISRPTADVLSVGAGDTLAVEVRSGVPLTLRVTGIYDAEAAFADPFWAGRAELTPRPLKAGNPILTPLSTLEAANVEGYNGTVDIVAGPGGLTADNLAGVSRSRETQPSLPNEIYLVNRLDGLAERIEAARGRLDLSVPVTSAQLLVVCWMVLLLAVSHSAVQRRPEAALGTLRGAPRRHRLLLTLGPTALVVLIAAPIGVAGGWLLVGRRELDMWAWVAAGGALLVTLVTAAVAERRALSVPLLEAMREVPSRKGMRGALVAEAAITAAAVAAVVQSLSGDTGIAFFVPVTVAAAIGLLLARLVKPAAAALGTSLLRQRRLAASLNALYLARRPGADRLVTLIVIAVALATHAISAWDVTRARSADQASRELGAAQVVTVQAVSRPALLTAVRAVDPAGQWAMAVARQSFGDSEVLAVDSARLRAVAGVSTSEAQRLKPAANEPVRVTGNELLLDFTVVIELSQSMTIKVALSGPHGEPIDGSFTVPKDAAVGKATYRVATPGCVTAPGCRLAWLSFPRSPVELRLTGIGQAGPDQTLLGAGTIGDANRWRTMFGVFEEVFLTSRPEYVSLAYVPSPLQRRPSTDIRMVLADAPVPLPALAVGKPSLAFDRSLTRHEMFTGVVRPIEVTGAMATLPGMTGEGVLVDLEYGDRLGDTLENDALLQVWLGPDAPSDVEDRLRAQGVVPLSRETVGQRTLRYQGNGEGLAATVRLLSAGLGLLLVALAMTVVAATDRRRRLTELKALREQGVGERVVRRSMGGYGGVVAVGFPGGVLAAAVAWWFTESQWPSLLTVVPALAAIALALAAVAALLRRRTARA